MARPKLGNANLPIVAGINLLIVGMGGIGVMRDMGNGVFLNIFVFYHLAEKP